LTGQIGGFELFHPDFNLQLPGRVGAECAEQFLMDALHAPSFPPEIFDDESLFVFLHIASMPYFGKCSK
jgi:hypothetical protein